jgi:hypothetical protein
VKISLVTAIFGDFDEIPPLPIGFDEYVLVSDVPIKSDWTNIVAGHGGVDSRLSSKVPKVRPDLFVSNKSSVWMDASLRDPESWLYDASMALLSAHDMSLFLHPDRTFVADEVRMSLSLFKYHRMPLNEQYAHYLHSGFTDSWGLWAGGVIARNHTEQNRIFGDRWLQENLFWSTQDQVSLPYLLEKMLIEPGVFPADLWSGPLKWHGHKIDDYAFPNKESHTGRFSKLFGSLFSPKD